jgi:hypothetical protein
MTLKPPKHPQQTYLIQLHGLKFVIEKWWITYFFMVQRKFSLRITLKMEMVIISQIAVIFVNLQNNEFVPRWWLMYSETVDHVFCFCCLCFDWGSRTSLASDGLNDWAHLSPALKSHESSNSHMIYYQEWIEDESRLKGRNTFDKLEQLLIQEESEHWKNFWPD